MADLIFTRDELVKEIKKMNKESKFSFTLKDVLIRKFFPIIEKQVIIEYYENELKS